jgi:hypothetical protein
MVMDGEQVHDGGEEVSAADAAILAHVKKGAEGSGASDGSGGSDGSEKGAEETDAGEKGADGKDGAEKGGEEGKDRLLSEKDTPDWTPEQREYLDQKFRERLGPYVRRAKEAEERVKALEAEVASAAQGKDAEWRTALAARGIPPDLVTKEEGSVVTRYEELRKQQGWYRRHFGTGYTASGRGEDTVSLEPAEVQQEYLRVTEELMELAPKAGAIRERVEKDLLERIRGGAKRETAAAAVKPVTLPKPPQIPARRGTGPGLPATGKRPDESGFDSKKAGENEDVGAGLDEETRRVVMRKLGKQ